LQKLKSGASIPGQENPIPLQALYFRFYQKEKTPTPFGIELFVLKSGGDLLSHVL